MPLYPHRTHAVFSTVCCASCDVSSRRASHCTWSPIVSFSPQGEAWEVAPVSKAEVWARCVELYSFNDLLGTQCMTDHPVGFQKMMCCVRADRSGGLEAVRLPPHAATFPQCPKCSCMYRSCHLMQRHRSACQVSNPNLDRLNPPLASPCSKRY